MLSADRSSLGRRSNKCVVLILITFAALTAAAPPPTPPVWCERTCKRILAAACGHLRADPAACEGCALAVGASANCDEADLDEACGPLPPPPSPPGPKKVMLWMANPFPSQGTNNQSVEGFIYGLKPHRHAFTGLAYQYFAVCGEGSNDPAGGNDCEPEDAKGMPHLAKGHPVKTPHNLGARLTAGLGTGYRDSPLELWPVISYGNPGTPAVLNRLIQDSNATQRFIADAISIAHEQKLTGFNIDFESQIEVQGLDTVALGTFLRKLVAGLHAASPSILLSYEGDFEDFAHCPPIAHVPDMDRWVSMFTYTASADAYLAELDQGVKAVGGRFGVGLCPTCEYLGEPEIAARFYALGLYNDTVRELDLWAADYKVPDSPQWRYYWPRLEKWLQEP